MTLALILLGLVSFIELFVPLSFLRPIRKIAAGVVALALVITTSWLVIITPHVWVIVLAFLSLYRVVNLLRLIDGHTQVDYLLRASRRSSYWLIGCQIAVSLFALIFVRLLSIHGHVWWYCLSVLQLITASIVFLSTWRSLHTTRPLGFKGDYADRDLPSISVAIPARNETDDLDACLQSLLRSDYPKLEILVLDDCSQNKRTPEIIRGFAHDGVRFIAGEVPPESWLAKNYAYEQLTEEANGEFIVFCGVDARFDPGTLRAMVEVMLQKKKSMVSWVPINHAPRAGDLEALLVQPMRYAWEFALPRRWLNRPPVLSTCWIISASLLHSSGTFKAVSRSIRPESYFAKQALRHDDGYSFLQSSPQIGLSSAKSFLEQRATAVRTRYPQLHRRLELAGLVSLFQLTVMVAPFPIAVVSWLELAWPLAALCTLSCLLPIAAYIRIVDLTYRQFLWRSLWLLPFALLYDIMLLNYSLWKYEFDEVVWKERNICIPIMQTVPHLPKS